MERIWSPWRSKYIKTLNNKKQGSQCFVCDAINSNNKNKEFLIVARRSKCIVIMNKYPYNSGHVLVCPLKHISRFEEFKTDELTDIMSTSQEIIVIMKELFNPNGFNFGLNVGQSAGAGLPEHLHFHIVPRWNGDANFTATIAETKFYANSLEDTRKKLYNMLNK